MLYIPYNFLMYSMIYPFIHVFIHSIPFNYIIITLCVCNVCDYFYSVVEGTGFPLQSEHDDLFLRTVAIFSHQALPAGC